MHIAFLRKEGRLAEIAKVWAVLRDLWRDEGMLESNAEIAD